MRHAAPLFAALSFASPLVASGQPPQVANARLEARSAAAGLAAVVSAELSARPGPAWIGWSVPTSHERSACCWSDGDGSGCRGCRLEGKGGAFTTSDHGGVRLEGPARVRVLLRAEGGRVARIRAFSEDCPLDAGGLAFVWLEDVRPTESVALLGRILREDADRKLREQAIFALSQSAEPAAVDAIVEAARRDPDGHVRGQALFWLAQTASRRAQGAIRAALDDDPELGVKKKAVFALSQLPKDEGVPLLIGVARTHASREVRSQAMFWLGQSGDPRALVFFEDVLRR